MQDSNKIIDRLKIALNAKSDNDLAKILEINQSTIAGWRRLNNFDTNRIINKFSNLNLNYLFYGIGEPFLEMKNDDNKEENLFVKETKSEYIAKLENELKKTDDEIAKEHKEIAHLDNELIKLKRQQAIDNQEIKNRLALLEMLLIQKNNT